MTHQRPNETAGNPGRLTFGLGQDLFDAGRPFQAHMHFIQCSAHSGGSVQRVCDSRRIVFRTIHSIFCANDSNKIDRMHAPNHQDRNKAY